jgi:hypothetical protein
MNQASAVPPVTPTMIVIGTMRSTWDGSIPAFLALRRAKYHAVKIALMNINPNGVTQRVAEKCEYIPKPN